MLNYLRTPETRTSQIAPTVGYSVTNFTTESFSFTAFDMAGQGKYRNLWETYYLNAQAVIFVVDSADRLRVAVARDELWMILDHKDISGRPIPILVLANKMDAKDAMAAAEISTSLGLDLIRGHKWNIHATCALEWSRSSTGYRMADEGNQSILGLVEMNS
ncbi:ADP-ribosylation factor family protein [Ostertagia ostertagi]